MSVENSNIGQISLAPYYGLRRVGLEKSAMRILGNFQISEICDAIEMERELFILQADELSSGIYLLIKNEKDPKKTKQLITLRRNIFNSRWPGEKENSGELYLTKQLSDLFNNWSEKRIKIDKLESEGVKLTKNVLTDLHADFQKFFARENVQNGLCFAQPNLYKKLLYLKKDGALNKNARRALISGVAYLYRMATKTSPFSHFTATGYGFMEDSRDAQIYQNWKPDTYEVNVLDLKFIELLKSYLLSDEKYRSELPLIWNTTVSLSEKQCYVLYQDESNLINTTIPAESIFKFPANSLFPVLEEIFSSLSSPILKKDLIETLKKVFNYDTDQLCRIVDKLVGLQVLVPSIDFDENHLNSLGRFLESEFSQDLPKNALKQIEELVKLLDDINHLPPTEKRNHLSKLATTGQDALSKMGIDQEFSLQKVLHNSVYIKNVPGLNKNKLANHMSNLGKLLNAFVLFNADYGISEWVNDHFRKFTIEHKGEIGLQEFFHYLCSINPDSNKNPFLNPEVLLEFDYLNEQIKLQDEFVDEIIELISDCGDLITLKDSFWDKWIDRTEHMRSKSTPLSMTFNGQFADNELLSSNALVINKTFSGYGTLFTHPRIEDTKRSSTKELGAFLKENYPTIDFVEIVSNMSFQGQIRPLINERNFYYPGQQIKLKDNARYPFKDVVIEACEDGTPILKNVKSKRKIIPLHRGTLSGIFFPPFYRFLNTFGHSYSPDFSIAERIIARESNSEKNQGIQCYPRIMFGNLILMRQTWSIRTSEIPKKIEGRSDFSYYKLMREWANEMGIPAEVFVTPMQSSYYLMNDVKNVSFKRSRKPFYLNWDDYTSFKLFLRYVVFEHDAPISFVEALPSIKSANGSSDDHVSEYQFEVYQNNQKDDN